MSYENETTLKGTVEQLRDIILCLKGADHESAKLVSKIETLAAKIESQTRLYDRIELIN